MSLPLFQSLNPEQKKAVEHKNGPLLVLAGAGSGKTKVLTHRIASLMLQGVLGRNILAVTFTNKAAKEMASRTEKLLQQNRDFVGDSSHPTVGTFHSICVRILRAEIESLDLTITRNFIIFDSDDTLKLMKLVMKEQGISDKEIKPKAVLGHISSAKNQLMTPEEKLDLMGLPSFNRFAQAVKKIYPLYQRKLIEHNALDFDDLLGKTVEIFQQNSEVLEKYQKRWPYVLVDEYQDTNIAQYKWIWLLTQKSKNLCVVGDDHQSIYAFRGADYRNILDFEKHYPETKTIKLEQNYRSTANILEHANTLIEKNKTGRPKKLWTENEEGEPISVTKVYNEKEEGQFIADKIQEIQSKTKVNYQNFAVLYRMNAQSRSLEEAFMRKQIPYQIIGGVRFFDRKEIKDIVAYLRLIFNPRDDVAFLRVINVPARKIGPATIEILKKYSESYDMSLLEVVDALDEIPELPESKKLILKQFHQLIYDLRKQVVFPEKEEEAFPETNLFEASHNRPESKEAENKRLSVSEILEQVIETTNFYKFLDDGTSEGEARTQNVKELFSVANRYDHTQNPLGDFLEGVALVSDLDHLGQKDTVTLMTVHASKGLEFPVVFLPGWEENIFPSSSSQFDHGQLEEERRLGYVAITRAEKECFISYTAQRTLFGKSEYSTSSQFITELSQENLNRQDQTPSQSLGRRKTQFSGQNYLNRYQPKKTNPSSSQNNSEMLLQKQPKNKKEAIYGISKNETGYTSGNKIRHADFGEGTVIKISGDIMLVAFRGKGIQKILASSAPIEKI